MSEMQKKLCFRNFVFDFVFKIKRMEKYPNFDTSVRITRHGLSACKLKNIKNDSLLTHFLSQILFRGSVK